MYYIPMPLLLWFRKLVHYPQLNIVLLSSKTLLFQIISTEWGAYSKGLPLTVFDREMDAASINPGEQVNRSLVVSMQVIDMVCCNAESSLSVICQCMLLMDRSLRRQ